MEFEIAKQAAKWFEVLKNAGDEERAAFARWIKESPVNMREFLLMTALDKEVRGIDPQRRHDVRAILNGAAGNVLPLNVRDDLESGAASTAFSSTASKRQSMPIATAAVVAIIAIGATATWFAQKSLSSHEYVTAVGEQRTVELEDGSVVHVNTRSRLEIHYSPQGRDVHLVSGEALFKVAKDAARPFRVHVANNTIQALGTQFNVYRKDQDTVVAVLEGLVRVSADQDNLAAVELGAGAEARINRAGRIVKHAEADVGRVASWRQRRLTFKGNTLAEIAAEFNRYNRAPMLVVEDAQLRERQFTANFDADDPESLIDFLKSNADIAVEKRGDTVTIHARQD